MEIVQEEKIEAAPQTTPPPAPEDYTKQVTEAFNRAEVMAQSIHEKVIGQPFTMMKLSNLTGTPVREIDNQLRFISQFFLLEENVELGVKKFKIIRDAKERLKFIEDNRNMRLAEISNWNMIAQLISEKVVEA